MEIRPANQSSSARGRGKTAEEKKMLLDENFNGQNKIQIAIARIQEFKPDDGYYLAFSGGKDSVALLHIATLAGVKFDAHYSITTVDPPELVRFIKTHHPTVERIKPEMSMFQLILANKWPPLRQQRYCCKILKERGGAGRRILTGVRWAESPRRKTTRHMIETCYHDGTKTYLHPIIDWTDGNVWEFIKMYNLPYCELYDQGFDRIGCILCPMNRKPQRDIERWPKVARAYIRTFDKLIKIRKRENKKCTFETGQELFDWWITRNRAAAKKSAAQPVLFE